jgi:signal transduction histidine kinase
MHYTKLLFTGLFLFILSLLDSNTSAQSQKTDSLTRVAETGNVDDQLEALSLLVNQNLYSNQTKAKELATKQLEISGKFNKPKWQADALGNIGTLFFTQGAIDSAEFYYQLAYNVLEKTDDLKNLTLMRVNLSSAQRLSGQFDKALENLQKSLEYFKEQKDESRISQVLSNIGAAYNEMGNSDKFFEYTLQALEIQEKIGSKRPMGITLINLCLGMSAKKNYSEAVQYGERAIKVFREINEPFLIGSAIVRTAGAMLFLGQDKRMIPYLQEAQLIAEKVGNSHLKEECLRLEANYYLNVSKFKEAKTAAFNALAITDTTNKPNLQYLYDLLITTSIHTNDKENAFKYYGKYIDVYKESVSEEWIRKISDMEVKYETEKKTIQIESLKNENRLYTRLNYALGFVFLLSLTSIFFFIRSVKNEREATRQKIIQLEKENQLIATQAVLDGETKERTRLARDLHDGLGGMLSVVKLSLFSMKGNLILPEENMESFDRALTQLDQSIGELRNVAHNLMPESLIVKGVKAALSDFAESVPNVRFHFFGDDGRFDEKLEVVIFRVAHELVSNSLKHSGAEEVNVQLIQSATSISLGVNDNGSGFDMSKMSSFKGMGLRNIQHRVTSFGGRIDFNSTPGNGTEVNVEFSLG